MFPAVRTKDPQAVEREVQGVFCSMFPGGDSAYVPRVFGWVRECFEGRHSGYLAIDARYHDFEHTLQGTLCMARLLLGRHKAGVQPQVGEEIFQLGLAAILFHDTGYLKQRGDDQGTGAKYTVVHVARSAEFAGGLLREKGFSSGQIAAVQNMIQCTGVEARLDRIPFKSESEKITGFALGTADLLGQMAAGDYVEKLPVLYTEFAEAARFDSAKGRFISAFSSADDLMRRTPGFWENFVLPKLDREFLGLYRFLNDPYPAGPNEYVSRIEANIERLRRELPAAPVAAG